MIDKDQIFKWLDRLNTKPSEDQAAGTDWIIRGIFHDLSFAVVRQTGSDMVMIQRSLMGVSESNETFKGISKNDRDKILFRTMTDLLTAGVRWRLEPADREDESQFEKLIIENYVYDDGFSKAVFLKEFYRVHDSSVLFIIRIRRYLKYGEVD